MSCDCGSVSSVLVCWSLDLGSTPNGSLSFSFPLAFFGLCKSTSKGNICIHLHINYVLAYDVYIETLPPSIKYTENSEEYTGSPTAGLEELALSVGV